MNPKLWIGKAFLMAGLFIASTPVLAEDGPKIAGELTFSGIQDFARVNKITDRDALLRALPQSLMGNFTLLKKSRARQGECITPEYPRVVTFLEQESLNKILVAFNGNPKPGCQDIEVVEHRGLTSEPRLIRVSPQGRILEYVTNPNQSPALRANDRCQSCHTSDWKGIWESYPTWSEAYGSDDDVLGKDGKAFRRLRDNEWRAKAPYSLLDWSGARENADFPFDPGDNGSRFSERPNLRLTLLLGSMTMDRAERRFSASEKEKLQFIHYWRQCSQARGSRMKLTQLPRGVSDFRDFALSRSGRPLATGSGPLPYHFALRLMRSDPLFREEMAELYRRARETIDDGGRYGDLPTLPELVVSNEVSVRKNFEEICRRLEDRMLKVAQAAKPVPAERPSVPLDPNAILNKRCLGSCHENGKDEILGSAKLSDFLSKGTMPKDGERLPRNEIEALLRHSRAVASKPIR